LNCTTCFLVYIVFILNDEIVEVSSQNLDVCLADTAIL
jgi:hypothetical protein